MVTDIRKLINSKPPKNGRFYTLAIDGRGASGKSSLLEFIKNKLPGFTFLNFDDYFEPKNGIEPWGFLNKARFSQDVVGPLKTNPAFTYRPYDWHSEPHIKERQIVVDKGLCIEGFLSISFDLDWDLRIWVETPKELCLERGVARDKDQKDALHVWRDVWQPKETEYIKRLNPLKTSDLIIDGTKPFQEQIT